MSVYSRIFRGLQLARRRRAADATNDAPVVMNDGELIYDVINNRFYFGGPDGLPIAVNTTNVDPADIGAVSSSDSRLFNQRVPTDGSVTNAKISVQGIEATRITGLATVATSGSYVDLSNKPTIPAAYSLPVATSSVLGGVKQGSNITIDVDGVISVAAPVTSLAYSAITGTPLLATVATSGSYADLLNKPTIPSAYSLPTATASVLGGIKIGSGLAIDGSGVVTAAGTYTLPAATTSVLGGMIVGAGLGVSSGTVSVTYGTTSNTTCQGNDARLSDARTPTSHVHGNITNAGVIGSTSGQIVVTTTDGLVTTAATISATTQVSGLATVATSGSYVDLSNKPTIPAAYSLPVATSTILGGVKQGSNVTIGVDGTLSVAAPVTSLAYSAITGTPTLATVATSGSYADLLNIPATFTPASHTQAISTVTGLQTALDGKQAATVTLAPPQITANQNNYAPGSCDVLVLTADAARNITGFTPATAGSSGFLTIINTGSFVITLKYQSTSSLATARMNTTYLADYNLEAGGGSALLWYDATSQFWRIL